MLLWTPAYGQSKAEHSYSSYVMIRDVTPKTYRRRWMIGRRGERGSGMSVPAARHDDHDGIYIYSRCSLMGNIVWKLSKFLRRSLMIFIIKSFRIIVLHLYYFDNFSVNMSFDFLQVFFWTREPSWNFELRPLLNPRGSPVQIPYRVQVLNIPVLLLACSQDWTCNLQMIVSLEA